LGPEAHTSGKSLVANQNFSTSLEHMNNAVFREVVITATKIYTPLAH
jgi:hypothetical protein